MSGAKNQKDQEFLVNPHGYFYFKQFKPLADIETESVHAKYRTQTITENGQSL